jgi:multidrug efflux pump subunit AcrA (membrane-fusion protein)
MDEQLDRTRRRLHAALGVFLLGCGAVLTAWLLVTRPEAPRHEHAALPPSVATVEILPVTTAAPVLGFGTVRPKHQLPIVPQVAGALVYIHDNLLPGKTIAGGELLFRIDPTPYEARVRQSQAEKDRLASVLGRYEEELRLLTDRLENARQMLANDEETYETTRRLFEDDRVGTRQLVIVDHQRVLLRRDAIAELESRRAVIPHLQAETRALLDAAVAHLQQAEFERERTEILCPFDARVDSVSAYTAQVVTPPLSIATLTDLEAFEMSVAVDPRELRWLAQGARPERLDDAGPVEALPVRVATTLRGISYVWRGYVTRFERIDEATRTARMVVEVRHEDMRADSTSAGDSTMTLAIGMYCRAELPARMLDDALLVPRHAVHDDRYVYVFEPVSQGKPSAVPSGRQGAELPDDDDAGAILGRIVRREIPRLRVIGDRVLVEFKNRSFGGPCELSAGDQVIVSPLMKPVQGMLVRLRPEASVARTVAPMLDSLGARLAQVHRPWDLHHSLTRATAALPHN